MLVLNLSLSSPIWFGCDLREVDKKLTLFSTQEQASQHLRRNIRQVLSSQVRKSKVLLKVPAGFTETWATEWITSLVEAILAPMGRLKEIWIQQGEDPPTRVWPAQ